MPNRLGYCGPDENEILLNAIQTNKTDDNLRKALKGFKAAYPYLHFIAETTGRSDPFDYDVVEAYWIGNSLLEKIPPSAFYDHLKRRFEAKFPKEHVKKLFQARAYAPFPHHALHVFNAFSSMGTAPDHLANPTRSDDLAGVLMDKCRISWGMIRQVEPEHFVVEYEPVQRNDGVLSLGPPATTKVMRHIQGRPFLNEAKAGDWVSFHWGFACTTLTPHQVTELRRYTLSDMEIANLVPPPE